jgi:hypothetical protein
MSYARSYIVQTLHGNPAASSLGRAHRLGAPYSSTVRPRGYALDSSLVAALLNSLWVRQEPSLTSVIPGFFGSTRVFSFLLGSSGFMLGKIVTSAPEVVERNST